MAISNKVKGILSVIGGFALYFVCLLHSNISFRYSEQFTHGLLLMLTIFLT